MSNLLTYLLTSNGSEAIEFDSLDISGVPLDQVVKLSMIKYNHPNTILVNKTHDSFATEDGETRNIYPVLDESVKAGDHVLIKFDRATQRERLKSIAITVKTDSHDNPRFDVRVRKEAETGLHYRVLEESKTFYALNRTHAYFAIEELLNNLLSPISNKLTVLEWSPRQFREHNFEVRIKRNNEQLFAIADASRSHLVKHFKQNYHRSDVIVYLLEKDSNVMVFDVITQALNDNEDRQRTCYLLHVGNVTGLNTPEYIKDVYNKLSTQYIHRHGKHFIHEDAKYIKGFDDVMEFCKLFPVKEEKKEPKRGFKGGKYSK